MAFHMLQNVEAAAFSQAESDDLESNEGTSDTGSSPQSSFAGMPPFNWPMRFGVGGMHTHGTLGGLTRRRSSASGGPGTRPLLCRLVASIRHRSCGSDEPGSIRGTLEPDYGAFSTTDQGVTQGFMILGRRRARRHHGCRARTNW